MSSEFKCCFTKIRDVSKHPNPEVERLAIATVYDFHVIVGKDKLNPGDFQLYVPIDSVLPKDLEELVFPEGSKIKLHGGRIKQIRIQKFPSQGLLIDPSIINKLLEKRGLKSGMEFKLEHDYKELLGIKKFEPPVPEFQQVGGAKSAKKKPLSNSNFSCYNGLSNIKWYPDFFSDQEEVVIQEKLHGSNCRAGIVPTQANTLLKKVKKLFGLLPKYENVYGSNNVELTNRRNYKGFYGTDVYGSVFNKIDVFNKLNPGEIVYGELIGEGIQKGYTYGHKEHHFVLFDVKVIDESGQTRYLDPEEVERFAIERGFTYVPVLYKGPYNKQLAYELTEGASVYDPNQKIREGIVIKSAQKYDIFGNGKRALKWVSEKYLDKDQTDFH